jgi:hypothetical protein
MSVPGMSEHCGPITADCPATCLASVISLMALNRLLSSPHEQRPETAGDVVAICREGRLGDYRGMGPRRRSEIQAGLVLAGFDISHQASVTGDPRGRGHPVAEEAVKGPTQP